MDALAAREDHSASRMSCQPYAQRVKAIMWAMVIVVLAVACDGQQYPERVYHQRVEYQRFATYPLGPFSAGDAFHITWTPKQVQSTTSEPYGLRLCVGIFGPYPSVETLKQSHDTTGDECPPTGAVVMSEMMQVRSDDDRPVATDLKLPSASGFYDVRQIAIFGTGAKANRQAAAGIIEIRAR